MRILQLTPGTGSFLCGSCLRDNALGQALRRAGHDVLVAPLYLPFVLEDARSGEADLPVRMGGINVYLQQKVPLLHHLPRFLATWLDSPRLLRWAASRASMTKAAGLGAMTLSMLRGEEGRQAAELAKLIEWIEELDPPDAVILSNAMLLGLARPIRDALNRPVFCTLQGEAPFLDALSAPFRERCWEALAERAADVDGFMPVSRFTADLMTERMRLDPERVHVVPNGIDCTGFAPAESPPARPTIGYLARMCPDKGLPTLVEGFLEVHRRGKLDGVRLRAGGVVLPEDEAGVRALMVPFQGGWKPVDLPTAFWLTGMTISAGLALWMITSALRTGEVSTVAPFRYTRILFSLGIAFAVFGEIPDFWTWVGAALIVGSGLYAFFRERQRARRSMRAAGNL